MQNFPQFPLLPAVGIGDRKRPCSINRVPADKFRSLNWLLAAIPHPLSA
jgi:hypothetical protein